MSRISLRFGLRAAGAFVAAVCAAVAVLVMVAGRARRGGRLTRFC